MERTLNLNDLVQYLKGVGPKKALIFKKLGIATVVDLLTYYPREWEDRSKQYSYNELQNGLKVSLIVTVEQTRIKRLNKRLGIFEAISSYKGDPVTALWFRNISYRYDVFASLAKKIQPGKQLLVYGVIERDFLQVSIRVDEYEIIEKGETPLAQGIVAHYPLTEGIDKRLFRQLIHQAIIGYAAYVDENLPEPIRISRSLMDRKKAIRQIHMPDDMRIKDEAKKRLAYEELFFLEYALLLSKRNTNSLRKYGRYEIRKTFLTPFKERLGFEFTKAQKHVINELFTDMRSDHPMNRLLQGDVGSGKTVVALSAMLLAVENGYQTAFMAPTEILAGQHYLTIKNIIGDLGVRIALLTSSLTKKDKNKLYKQIASGEINIIVGTQALIQDKVKFANLSFVVIDEQHRFGVIQRSKLIQKSPEIKYKPDVLVMTATPIPRTLALTVYGDLDISTLDELPAGRKMITTLHMSSEAAYQKVIDEVHKGNQAYVVFPLVEESDMLELKSAVREADILSNAVFRNLKVGVLHGQLTGMEKESIMRRFVQKEIDVLISTTVIEVGIDVPNATIMVIEDAHRFGLATLHQLRGRVGRSGKQSYCILVGDAVTLIGRERIKSILSTNDGFKLGEIDLSLRGPGEFFGVAQHGMPELKIADLINDRALVEYAHEDALAVLTKSFHISTEEEKHMQAYFKKIFEDSFGLIKIG